MSTNVIKQIVQGEGSEQTIRMVVRSNERGPQGEKGDTGDAATIAAGQAYSIPAGSQPNVVNTGTANNAVFDFYIPKGDTGAQGPRGERGQQGVPGPQGAKGDAGKDGSIHYTAGPGINITDSNEIQATGTAVAAWGGIQGDIDDQTDLKDALDGKQATLTAGEGISISSNVVSTVNKANAKKLTSADYNWNSTTHSATPPFNAVALWLLDSGLYTAVVDVTRARVCRYAEDNGVFEGIYLVNKELNIIYNIEPITMSPIGGGASSHHIYAYVLSSLDYTLGYRVDYTDVDGVEKIISSYIRAGNSAPTSRTKGLIGLLYEDKYNADLYICTSADDNLLQYTWEKVNVVPPVQIGEVISEPTTVQFVDTANIVDGAVTKAKIDFSTMPGSYSTSEVDTGYTWIDDSPIYKKTIIFGTLPNATSKDVNHGIQNLGMVIKCEAYAYDPTSIDYTMVPIVSSSSYPATLSINDTRIRVTTTNDRSTYTDSYVTIYYTKTS